MWSPLATALAVANVIMLYVKIDKLTGDQLFGLWRLVTSANIEPEDICFVPVLVCHQFLIHIATTVLLFRLSMPAQCSRGEVLLAVQTELSACFEDSF